MNFKTNLKTRSIYGINEHLGVPDVDIEATATAYIDWVVEIEARDWGVKSISVFATKVVSSVEWEVESEFLTDEEKNTFIAAGGIEFSDTIAGLIEIDSAKDWVIDSAFDMQEGGLCTPDDIEFDLETNVITIS